MLGRLIDRYRDLHWTAIYQFPWPLVAAVLFLAGLAAVYCSWRFGGFHQWWIMHQIRGDS